MLKRHNFTMLAVTIISGIAGYGVSAVANQPHMNNALVSMQNAYAELGQAVPNKGGHRVNAMGLLQRAINEVNAGLAAGS